MNKVKLSDFENKRMTEPALKNSYTLIPLNSIDLIDMYRDYDVFFAHLLCTTRLGQIEDRLELRKIDEYHEDMGNCLWWEESQIQNGLPTEEPSYIGSPLCNNWNNKYKYFVEIVVLKKWSER